MFETLVVHPAYGTTKCLVYPFGPGELGIIFPQDVMYSTHRIRIEGKFQEARMFVGVKNKQGESYSVDPFDFKWNAGKCLKVVCYPVRTLIFAQTQKFPSSSAVLSANQSRNFAWDARRSGDSWERVTFITLEWRVKGSNIAMDDGAIVDSVKCDSSWQIECPAIVFVVLPKKEKEPYSIVKMCTNYLFGVQSQCLVKATHDKQGKVDM